MALARIEPETPITTFCLDTMYTDRVTNVMKTVKPIIAALSNVTPWIIPNGLKTAPAIFAHTKAISSPNTRTSTAERRTTNELLNTFEALSLPLTPSNAKRRRKKTNITRLITR